MSIISDELLDGLCANLIELQANVTRVAKGRYLINAERGSYFDERSREKASMKNLQPVIETLVGLGFDIGAAHSLAKKYPTRLLEEWADITQAASERFGTKFFKKSPMAFLVDSVSKASRGQRTAPDWWHEVRRSEQKKAEASSQSRRVFADIRTELFGGISDQPDPQSTSIETVADILKTVK